MTITLSNMVRETTITEGDTDPYSLGGASGRFLTFVDGAGDAATVYYMAFDANDFEYGVGTVTAGSPDTLSRDSVVQSTNSDAAVDWGAGTKTIVQALPIEKVVILDENDALNNESLIAPQNLKTYTTSLLLNAGVIDRDLTAPPGSPTEGDIYIIAASATGAWSTHDKKVTFYDGSAWRFIAPVEGMSFWVNDEDAVVRYNGTDWVADFNDDVLQDIFRLYFYDAEAAGDRLNMAYGIADPFADESDVDTSASTGESYDSGGDFYSPIDNTPAPEDNGSTVSLFAGGNITQVARNFSINNSTTVKALGFYRTSAISGKLKILKRNSAGNYDVVVDEAVNHTGSGWEEFDLSSPFEVPSTGEYYVGWYSSSNYEMTGSQSRAYIESTDATGTGLTLTEDTGVTCPVRVVYAEDIANLDLQSKAFTASAAPDTARLALFISGTDASTLTLNTDLTGSVSRDDGSNFAIATLEDAGTLADGTRMLVANDIDISGQPSDTNMKWRVQTANGIDIQLNGVILQWGA